MLALGGIGLFCLQAKADTLRLLSKSLKHDIEFTFSVGEDDRGNETHKIWVKARDSKVEKELNRIFSKVEDIDINASDNCVNVILPDGVSMFLSWEFEDEIMMTLKGKISKQTKNSFNGIYELGDIGLNIGAQSNTVQLTLGMNQKN